ncbi:MAG: carbohydrate kinase [Candidatus Portiera sp.]|nr:carbohydrate kinase [Portiera sp.]
MTQNKILCFGELFVDMFADRDPSATNQKFFQHPGGSPAIVAFAAAGYGANAYFIGKLSDDHFAKYLTDYMLANNVKMDYAINSKEHRCTISFVRHDTAGEREFEIYRDSHKAADLAFSVDEWQEEWFTDAKFLHCGSNCQLSLSSHQATEAGAKMARGNNTLVSYDPNIRPAMWAEQNLLRQRVHEIFPYADLVKMSDDEAEFLFPGKSEEVIAQELFAMSCQIMLITRGGKGASAYHPQHPPMHLPGIKVEVVDTTGAGDNFISAFMSRILHLGLLSQDTSIRDFSVEQLEALIKFANAAATMSVTARGGMDSSPSLEQVEQVL